ncbi:MAG: rRNA adenine dimethyltransferase family protein [bacterium]
MSLLDDTKKILLQNSIRPQKKLGQHFLVNEEILNQIISAAQLSKEDTVLEIGAGIGILTSQLVPLVSKVIAVEIAPVLINILNQELAGYTNVLIIKEDILKVNLSELLDRKDQRLKTKDQRLKIEEEDRRQKTEDRLRISDLNIESRVPSSESRVPSSESRVPSPESRFSAEKKIKVVANLPYYIVTPVIIHLLQAKENFSTLILMVQKEVGDRILAKPGSKTYGALSILVQYHCQVERICEVSRQCFYPHPQVDSVVLRLNILDRPSISVKDEQFFFKLVRAAFSKRRKMLINAISDVGISKERLTESLVENKIDPKRRGETLTLEEFGRLSDFLKEVESSK